MNWMNNGVSEEEYRQLKALPLPASLKVIWYEIEHGLAEFTREPLVELQHKYINQYEAKPSKKLLSVIIMLAEQQGQIEQQASQLADLKRQIAQADNLDAIEHAVSGHIANLHREMHELQQKVDKHTEAHWRIISTPGIDGDTSK